MASSMWPMKKLIEAIAIMLLTKFDCFIIIEGNRGLGKSTLAYQIAQQVNRLMSKHKMDIGLKRTNYIFKPKRDLLYKRQEVLDFFTRRKAIGIADEMINVSFSRDFWQEDQKNLIKMINMNRDHNNLFLACVPKFQAMDTQIKNLCKMRITVVRRGVAIIQTPNRTIYSTDSWDTKVNEGIERMWLKKQTKNPQYNRLTTYRGYIKFPKLKDVDEKKYQKIKDDKRNSIYNEQEEQENKVKQETDSFEILMKRLLDNGIKNSSVLEGYAMSKDMTIDKLKARITNRLKKEGKNTAITDYYWEDAKKTGKTKTNKLKGMINSI